MTQSNRLCSHQAVIALAIATTLSACALPEYTDKRPAGNTGVAGVGGSGGGGNAGTAERGLGGARNGGGAGNGGSFATGGIAALGGNANSAGARSDGGTATNGGGTPTTTGAGNTGGISTGPAAGGVAAGGVAAGGVAAGGVAAGGVAAGGVAAGGVAAGGVAAGGVAGGGVATGGAAGSQTSGAGTTSKPITLPPSEDFTDKVGSASIEMIYIPGGTFTLGCESGTCEPDTSPVENITVSPYHIMKTEVSTAMWSAVGHTEGTWYDCWAIACEFGKQTGHAYRMMTEAEFEYAAKKHLSKLSQVTATEEWAFNSWETKYSCKPGDVDPLGPNPGAHVQKTRRDKATGDRITGRLIRSIDGIGPKCRLTVSAKTEYPPGYPSPCYITPPELRPEPTNSYRDPRWVTGSDAVWAEGSPAIGKFKLRVWDDGTANLNNTDGQWFTSNNIAFVFVPNSGSLQKFPYIFLDQIRASLISETSFTSGGFDGKIERKLAESFTKPTVSGLKSGEALAAAAVAAGAEVKMVDMVNIPESAKKQDLRLLDTANDCWFQNNINAGNTFNYRKDVDAGEFRFAVVDGGQVAMLANGSWFTVNDTFLRVTHSTGYTTDYLYAVTSDGYFFHDSFQAYERGDFRMFEKFSNTTGTFPATCINNSCSSELPKGAAASAYASQGATGKSTFVPAPCPTAGCK